MTRLRLAAILSSALLLSGCAPNAAPASAIETTVTDAAGGTFSLSEVEGIAASSFLVVCPYETEESVETRLGAEWDASGRAEDEGAQTIALVDGGRVESVELDRDAVDFCSTESWELLPLDALLEVSESGEVTVTQ